MKELLFILFLASAIICSAQKTTDFGEPVRVINAWLDAQKDFQNIPGISAGIVVDQDLIWSEGFGFADPEHEIPATDVTIYSICSISKLFTAISIMQLRDQGKLDLDDEIHIHLPWFDLKQTYPESGPITIRSLLTHSSGLPRDSDFPYWADPSFPFPTAEQVREKLSDQETLYPASSNYQYSNLGMTMLGQMIEEISGESYEKYITSNILNPLGLSNTHPGMVSNLETVQMATGYSVISRKGAREKLNAFNTSGITPAAGLTSNVKDLAGFASWQFRILDEPQDQVLNGNTLKEMQRVHWQAPNSSITRGLGFGIYEFKNTIMVGHYGKCPGYLSQFKLIPEEKWGFIFLANCLGIDSDQFIKSMYNVINTYDRAVNSTPSPEVNLEDYSGIYYDFWDGESLIVPWKGNLAVFSLNTSYLDGPDVIVKHISGDLFRMILKDDSLGPEIRFDRGDNGNITKYWIHSFYMTKMGK